MQSVLLVILAALPLAQVLLGCVVIPASPRAPTRATSPTLEPPVVVGPDVLRAMRVRELGRGQLVRRIQAGRFDPLAVNLRRTSAGNASDRPVGMVRGETPRHGSVPEIATAIFEDTFTDASDDERAGWSACELGRDLGYNETAPYLAGFYARAIFDSLNEDPTPDTIADAADMAERSTPTSRWGESAID